MPSHIENHNNITIVTNCQLSQIFLQCQSFYWRSSKLTDLHKGDFNIKTGKSYGFAHIISRLNYIMPIIAGYPIHIPEKVMKVCVRSTKFIYGKGAHGISHENSFKFANCPKSLSHYISYWLTTLKLGNDFFKYIQPVSHPPNNGVTDSSEQA